VLSNKGFLICFLISILFISIVKLSADGLVVKLLLDKKTYLLREPIYYRIRMKNTSSDTILYSIDDSRDGELKNSLGHKLKYKGIREIRGNLYDKFPPSDTFLPVRIRELLWQYGELEGLMGGRCYLPVDNYTFQVFCFEKKGEYPIKIGSNIVQFKVVKPEGFEKQAHKLYVKGLEFDKKGNVKKAIEFYYKVIEKYPNSVYGPHILDKLVVMDKEKSFEHIEELLDLYPESYEAQRQIGTVPVRYANMGVTDEEFIRNELKKIAEKHKGTKIEEAVNKTLKKFEDKTSYYYRMFNKRKQMKEKIEKENEEEK